MMMMMMMMMMMRTMMMMMIIIIIIIVTIIAFKAAIRDFYNLLSAQQTVSYIQVAMVQSCANQVLHSEHLSRATWH